jgi:arylsulfatase A-like enzyme
MAPHSPVIYPEAYSSLYDPATDVPPLPREANTDAWKKGLHPRMYATETYLDPAWKDDPEGGRRECMVAYWRTITYIDDEIGRLLDGLDALHLTDRTIVVLVSDHGFSFGYHDRFYKDALYDHSSRTPLIITVPGRPDLQGRACTRPVEHVDIYPTLMELCGLDPPAGLDGTSLVPLMERADAPHKPAFVTLDSEYGAHIERAVRTDRFKFIYWESGEHVLYDLARDPGEYRNLYGDPRYTDVVAEHFRLLEEHGVLAASWNNYRRGVPGTFGVPSATVSAPPIMGHTVEVEFGNSSPNREAALLIAGLLGTYRHGPGEGRILVAPLLFKPVALPAQGLSVPITIPPDPLAGLRLRPTGHGTAGRSRDRIGKPSP